MCVFSNWLEGQYIEWMAKMGRVGKQGEFANYLGISQPLLNKYLNGRRTPGKVNIDKMAVKLGDEIYDCLELEKPDPILRAIINSWDDFDEPCRQEFKERLEQHLSSD